ncbi:hypothetical protein E5288_WYG008868 [Bos mutus]|uniref:Uncharacterized protein n=1 Tax=Bos mutus TaxID=72004 RepID=A0A6B0QVM4_9CETA|nr:hypothetical protein [Bos mutus]
MQPSYNYQISQVLLKHSFQLQPDVSREKCAILLKSTFGTLRVNQCATHQTKGQIHKGVVKEASASSVFLFGTLIFDIFILTCVFTLEKQLPSSQEDWEKAEQRTNL